MSIVAMLCEHQFAINAHSCSVLSRSVNVRGQESLCTSKTRRPSLSVESSVTMISTALNEVAAISPILPILPLHSSPFGVEFVSAAAVLAASAVLAAVLAAAVLAAAVAGMNSVVCVSDMAAVFTTQISANYFFMQVIIWIVKKYDFFSSSRLEIVCALRTSICTMAFVFCTRPVTTVPCAV